MLNFLRLRSLRIPVMPEAEASAAQKPYPETEGLDYARPPFGGEVRQHRKQEKGILNFLKWVNTVNVHIYTE
ncbi:MAG: hypothetical protein AB9834_07510 [Lentimicrobium sp.]